VLTPLRCRRLLRSLSTKLVDMDGAVSRMRAPLLTLQARVSGTKSDTSDALAALQAGLARRAALAERRATLQLMVDATHAVAKVERLLSELAAVSAADEEASETGRDALADGATDALDAPGTPRASTAGSALPLPPGESGGGGGGGAAAALLERAAAEATRLQLFLSRGGALPFVSALRPRANAASAALGGALRRATRRALRRRDAGAARDGLVSLAALHGGADAEALVAEALVRPIVLETLAENAAAAAAGGAGGAGAAADASSSAADAPRASASGASAAAELAPVFEALQRALERRAGFLLALCRGADAPRGLCLPANALLCEVDAALAVQRAAAFSPGRPAAFRANHAAARAFLAWLEGAACGDDASAAALRAAPATDAFLRRWNLAAYFSLRFADVAGALEAALPPPAPGAPLARAPAPAAGGELGFALAPAAAAAAALRRCWAEDVYIPALADKFLTLSLQVAARAATWLAAGALRRGAADASAAAAAAAAASAAPGGAGAGGGADGSGGAHGSGGGAHGDGGAAAPAASAASVTASAALASAASASARNGGGEWAVAAPPDDLAAASADAAALAAFLTGAPYTALVAAALSHAPADARAAALEALAEAAAALVPPADALAAAAAAALADRCVEVLRQLRGITATYRMTNKPLPTRHSHFMPAVLAPLRSFLDAAAAAAPHAPMPQQLRERIIAAVAEAVTVRLRCARARARSFACACTHVSRAHIARCCFSSSSSSARSAPQTRYDDLARDLVTTVRKTESSLKRLKDRRGGGASSIAAAGGSSTSLASAGGSGGAAAAEVSDTDKICRQLALDAAEFARQLARFGVDAATMPAFASLWQGVATEGEPLAF
jgi:hypothetical protein